MPKQTVSRLLFVCLLVIGFAVPSFAQNDGYKTATRLGGPARFYGPVANRAALQRMMKNARANAGITTVPRRTHEVPVEDWDRLIAINLRGVALALVRDGVDVPAGRDQHQQQDAQVRGLLEVDTPVVTIYGKTSALHVREVLRCSPEENLEMIRDTVAFLKSHRREVVYDCEHAIDGWLSGKSPWLTLADEAARAVAPLVGADPDEVAVMGQTTSNLHQLLATLFDPAHPTRRVIVGDALNFASDTHALHSHLRLRGLDPETHLRIVPSRDGRILWIDDVLEALTDDVQLLVLPAVVFTSGQLLDVPTITRKARERGILVLWDLSHSIGAVPHALDRDGVDGAFWCHYKWLNAGPGAVGGLYLNRRHFGREPGLAGWWGVRPERRLHRESPLAPDPRCDRRDARLDDPRRPQSGRRPAAPLYAGAYGRSYPQPGNG